MPGDADMELTSNMDSECDCAGTTTDQMIGWLASALIAMLAAEWELAAVRTTVACLESAATYARVAAMDRWRDFNCIHDRWAESLPFRPTSADADVRWLHDVLTENFRERG